MVQELASSLIKKLQEKNLTIAVAESLTGGLVAASLTEIPGASKVFKGSITAYADEIKQDVLNVKAESISKFSSISEQVAERRRKEGSGGLRKDTSGGEILARLRGLPKVQPETGTIT